MDAENYIPVNSAGIPINGIQPVAEIFNLKQFKKLDQKTLDNVPGKNGYDHNFCCKIENSDEIVKMATLKSTKTGRIMQISGSQVRIKFRKKVL